MVVYSQSTGRLDCFDIMSSLGIRTKTPSFCEEREKEGFF